MVSSGCGTNVLFPPVAYQHCNGASTSEGALNLPSVQPAVEWKTPSVDRGGQQGDNRTVVEQNCAKRQQLSVKGPTIQPEKGVSGCERSTTFHLKLEIEGTGPLVGLTEEDVLGASSHTTPSPMQRPGGKFVQPTNSKNRCMKSAGDPLKGQVTIARGAMETASPLDRGGLAEISENSSETVLVRQPSTATPCNKQLKENNVRDDATDVGGVLVVPPSSTESLQKSLPREALDGVSLHGGSGEFTQHSSTNVDMPCSATVSSSAPHSIAHTMSAMAVQRRTFLVARGPPGEGKPNNPLLLEEDLGRLQLCEVTGKKLNINHVFGCVDSSQFLLNLKTKSTGRLVDSIVKTALGAFCNAIPMATHLAGEKFVPARSSNKRTRTKTAEATIEREATRVFAKSVGGQAYLLDSNGEISTYSYRTSTGLVLKQKDEDDVVDVGCDAEAVAAVELDRGTFSTPRGFAGTTVCSRSLTSSTTPEGSAPSPAVVSVPPLNAVDNGPEALVDKESPCSPLDAAGLPSSGARDDDCLSAAQTGTLSSSATAVFDLAAMTTPYKEQPSVEYVRFGRDSDGEASSAGVTFKCQAMPSDEEIWTARSTDFRSDEVDSVVHFANQSSADDDAVEGDDEKRPFKARRANAALAGEARLDGPAESVLACGFSNGVEIRAGCDLWHSEKQPPDVLPSTNSSSLHSTARSSAPGIGKQRRGGRKFRQSCNSPGMVAGAIGHTKLGAISPRRVVGGATVTGWGSSECNVEQSKGFHNVGSGGGASPWRLQNGAAAHAMRERVGEVVEPSDWKLDGRRFWPQSTSGATRISANFRCLSGGNAAAISFQNDPDDFQEKVRRIAMEGLKSQSSMVNSLDMPGGVMADETKGITTTYTRGGVATPADDVMEYVSRGAEGMRGRGSSQRIQGHLQDEVSRETLQSYVRDTLPGTRNASSIPPADMRKANQEDEEEAMKAAWALLRLSVGCMSRAEISLGIHDWTTMT